jgi:hypothetical protein
MTLKHISDFLPKPQQDTAKPEPKALSTDKPASKKELRNNIVVNALALKAAHPKTELIAAKNIIKALSVLIPTLEGQTCKH